MVDLLLVAGRDRYDLLHVIIHIYECLSRGAEGFFPSPPEFGRRGCPKGFLGKDFRQATENGKS